jgi:glycosidase
MKSNPLLYELNTRVWIKRFVFDTKLNQVPIDFFKKLRERGFNYVWLMGVWQTNKNSVKKYCFEDGLIKEYNAALPDWKENDVIGSPYSIEDYKVSPDLGGEKALIDLKQKLNELGLKLILDFIPNHFSVESSLLNTNPQIFLRGDESDLQNDPKTFFKKEDKIFAHGKDPFFDAWQDTVQVNYFSGEAKEFMYNRLEQVSKLSDGIRCDMAMLINNPVFAKTWETILSKSSFERPQNEFWSEAIPKIKSERDDFIFIAEVYWDKEWELQQFGFDFTYDKKLLERLKSDNVEEIKKHLWADIAYQKKCTRFLENHDEQRAIKVFGEQKVEPATVILFTLPGMKLIYDGQSEGKRIKLPVQLGREPDESPNKIVKAFYDKLYQINSNDIFREGNWQLLEPQPAWKDNQSHKNILSWLWSYKKVKVIVVVNYSGTHAQCLLNFDTYDLDDEISFKDLLNEKDYKRSAEEIKKNGLYIDLQPYKSHIFLF